MSRIAHLYLAFGAMVGVGISLSWRGLLCLWVCCAFSLAVNFGSNWRGLDYGVVQTSDAHLQVIGPYDQSVPIVDNVRVVVSTQSASAALTYDGKVVCWGNTKKGGAGAKGIDKGVKDVASSWGAFAVLKHDGSLIVFGDAAEGGIAPAGVDANVTAIYGSRAGFLALKNDGTAVLSVYDKYVGTLQQNRNAKIISVVAIHSSFLALLEDGTVQQYSQYLWTLSQFTNVARIFSGDQAFVLLMTDNTITCVGSTTNCGSLKYISADTHPTLPNIKQVYSSYQGWAALDYTGKVACFGNPQYGGSCSVMVNVASVSATFSAFAALHNDGTVSVWGTTDAADASVPSQLRDVKSIRTTSHAFLALDGSGALTSWGDVNKGAGSIPANITGIVSIHNSNTMFIVVTDDGVAHAFGYGNDPALYRTVSNVVQVWGSTDLRGVSEFPHAYSLDRLEQGLEVPFPTSLPSGQPTGRPSVAPTTAPTSAPTSYPTRHSHSAAFSLLHAHGFSLDKDAFSDGEGLHYIGGHVFSGLGHTESSGQRSSARLYLTAEVYDSGFGPSTGGQFVTFFVNDEPVTLPNDTQKVLCAPRRVSTDLGCSGEFMTCFYNLDVTDRVRNQLGGSLEVRAKSQGVLSSSCPHTTNKDGTGADIIYVRYNLTAMPEDTPQPTYTPTLAPTPPYQINGLQLDINSLDVWVLLQIAVGVGMCLGGLGAMLVAIRSRSHLVHQHQMGYSALKLGMLGTELASMVFMIVKFAKYGFPANAIVLGVFRLFQVGAGVLVILCLFGPDQLKEWGGLLRLLDMDHYITESKIYTLITAFSLADVTFLGFLPWRASRFTTLSKGYPVLWVWRVAFITTIGSVIVSLCCQIPYLAATSFSADRDLLFVVNIILLCIKAFLYTMEYYFKSDVLTKRESTTALKEGYGDGDSSGGGVAMIDYTSNPMMTASAGDGKSNTSGGDDAVGSSEDALEMGSTRHCKQDEEEEKEPLLQLQQKSSQFEKQIMELFGKVRQLEQEKEQLQQQEPAPSPQAQATSLPPAAYSGGSKRSSVLLSKRLSSAPQQMFVRGVGGGMVPLPASAAGADADNINEEEVLGVKPQRHLSFREGGL